MDSSRVILLLIGIYCVTLIGHVDAECCHPTYGLCEDGTRTKFFCGIGKCNIFGCNCDGGCRSRESTIFW